MGTATRMGWSTCSIRQGLRSQRRSNSSPYKESGSRNSRPRSKARQRKQKDVGRRPQQHLESPEHGEGSEGSPGVASISPDDRRYAQADDRYDAQDANLSQRRHQLIVDGKEAVTARQDAVPVQALGRPKPVAEPRLYRRLITELCYLRAAFNGRPRRPGTFRDSTQASKSVAL